MLEYVGEKERCPKCRGTLHNTKTGDWFYASCRTYSCPVCGPRKVKRLRRAIIKWLKGKRVRIWTFTLSSKYFTDPVEHFKVLQEAFRRTIKDIRRLKRYEQNKQIQYIAIREPHQSGFAHLHVLVTQYIRVELVQELFDSHIRYLLLLQGRVDLADKICNVHIEAVYTTKGIANYLVKYITKSIQTKEKPYRVHYTKSNFRLFPKKEKSTETWIFFRGIPILDIDMGNCSNLSEEDNEFLEAILGFIPGDAWEPPP